MLLASLHQQQHTNAQPCTHAVPLASLSNGDNSDIIDTVAVNTIVEMVITKSFLQFSRLPFQ